ncbi:hypothetical protein CVIRNUC_007081 [Coccomyxa viridis]|uniref:Uncharacterized protein n=1 Tax=Coccomyxa viridis TaxID=1274662 RepID=A0AAV1IAI3_9CHLO|nr:hypothetical protein CVIRNUC_007081 [Coccomyxa viridis]
MTPRKRAAATEMSGICAMPDSPVAINRGTGRTAVGPWCGAFEQSASAADHDPPSPTLFMDRAGSAHRSLDGCIKEPRGRYASPHGAIIDCSLALAGAANRASANRKAELRDHSREVALAASKGSPKGSIEARCVPRSGGNSAKRHAGHQVFQPSGRFF